MAEATPSIRTRLSHTLVLVSLVWGVAVAAVVTAVVRHEVDEIMDATLREASQILHALLQSNVTSLSLGVGRVMPAPPHKEELVWQIVDPQQGVLLRSHEAPPSALTAPASRGIVDVDATWRVLVTEFDMRGRLLMVAQTGTERQEAKLEATRYTVGGALVVGLLCAWWLRRRVRRELQPLSVLSQAVAQFDPLQPGAVLPDPHRLELQPVSDAITLLGARLASRVAHERAFSAHAAHALRTPLAGMMAQLAAAQRASPPDAQPMLQLARQAADRLRRVVSAILTLFRSGTQVKWQRVQLADLMSQLSVENLTVTVEPPSEVMADPDLLAAAMANLLDNAVRHGAAHVHIRVQRESTSTCIRLRDDGPGIEDERRALLQQALSEQNYRGQMGMGLMLADLVARAHGGRLLLPRPSGGGCVVLLRLGLPGPDVGAPEGDRTDGSAGGSDASC